MSLALSKLPPTVTCVYNESLAQGSSKYVSCVCEGRRWPSHAICVARFRGSGLVRGPEPLRLFPVPVSGAPPESLPSFCAGLGWADSVGVARNYRRGGCGGMCYEDS